MVRQRPPHRNGQLGIIPLISHVLSSRLRADAMRGEGAFDNIFVTKQLKSPKCQSVFSNMKVVSLRVIQWVVLAGGRITCS